MTPNPLNGHRDPSETRPEQRIRRRRSCGIPADPALAKYSGVSCGDLSAARGEL
jgi:hypothetical protein